jgi:hypothetical protein
MAGESQPTLPINRDVARGVGARDGPAAQGQVASSVFVVAESLATEFGLGYRPNPALRTIAREEGWIELRRVRPDLDDA